MKILRPVILVIIVMVSIAWVSAQPTDAGQPGVIAWSPSGDRIAIGSIYNTCEFNGPSLYNIKIINSFSYENIINLSGSSCTITALSWSSDGQRLAAASLDSFGVRVWDSNTGTLLSELQIGQQGITSLAWSHDQTYIIASTVSNEIAIIDPTTGAVEAAAPVPGTLLAYRPGTSVIATGGEYEPSVYVADLFSQDLINELQISAPATNLAWNYNGSKLAASTLSNNIFIWNDSGQLQTTILAHIDDIVAIDWRPESNYLASAGRDGVLRLWDTNTGLLVEQFTITGQVTSIDWNADGSELAYIGLDQPLQIVEPSPIPSARVIAWSQDGLLALAGGGDSCNPNNPNEFNISIIDPNTLLTIHILSGLTCRAQSLSWSPDGDRIAAASFDGFGVTIWDVDTSQILAKDLTGEQGVMSVAWNVDGTLIAVGYMNNFVAIIDASTGARVDHLDTGGTFVDWTADENRLAVASAYYNSVYIYDMDAQNAAIKLVGHTEPVMDLEWNTAGTRIASGSRDTSVRVWSANSGQSILTLNHPSIVDAVAWRPNTNQLASAGRDRVLRLWDTNTGLLIEQFTITGQVTSIDWNTDGSELAYIGLDQPLQIVEPSPIPSATLMLTPTPRHLGT